MGEKCLMGKIVCGEKCRGEYCLGKNVMGKIVFWGKMLQSHPNQVIQHQKVDQTLLYWYLLRNLAQNCAKIYNLSFPASILLSKLNIFAILLRLDGKFSDFFAKNMIAKLASFPHCAKEGITKEIWRNIFEMWW